MNRLTAILFLTLALASCGNHRSVAPTVTAPSPLAPTMTPTLNGVSFISGFVSDTGFRPLAGARIEALDGPQAGASATADTTGQFSLSGTFDSASRFRATKDGYVAATQAWNCSIGAGCSAMGAQPWLGFYLASSLAQPVNIAGDYTLTFIADSACTDFPNELRTRTYAATITPSSTPNIPADTSFKVTMGGASFLANSNSFSIGVVGDYVDLWLDGGHDPPLVEQLAPNTYLAFSGNATASVGTSPVSSISTSLDGWIEYSGQGVTLAHCESKNHRLILTRR